MTTTPTPLAEMSEGDRRGLSVAPVIGFKVSDYDCCSTEAWILVGPSLHGDTLAVEIVEARCHSYHYTEWEVTDGVDVASLADAVAWVDVFAADETIGHLPCRCDWP